MTLFWSILMISIMMYMFGLCFLQAVTLYLNENVREDVDEQTYEDIKYFWSGVLQSMMTLFWAVTGGADWEPLAKPIGQADSFFYGLFFFYIAFAAFAVLNVLTGMFVDTAMKVAQQDEENVVEELINRPEVVEFKRHVQETLTDVPPKFITKEFVHESADDGVVMKFQKALEINHDDCNRVFAMMDSDHKGMVDIDEFVKGCCHCQGSVSGLDMIFLMTEVKHISKQFFMSMDYIEDRFNELWTTVSAGEKSSVPSWSGRVSDQQVS